VERLAAGAVRLGLMLERSARCADSAALLGPRARRRTHYASFARSVQTTAASQSWKRATRAARGPALLAAPEIAPAGQRPPRAITTAAFRERTTGAAAKGRPGGRRRASAAPRSAGLVAARAARFVV